MVSADTAGAEDLTGRRVGGFLLTKRLGRGGFGSVYRGHPDVGVPRAVKVLHDRGLASALRGEAQTLLDLKHPRIVEFVHADLASDPPYYVMELVDGGPLSTVIPLDGEKALPIVRAVLEGLAHAHAKGIAHLDLKPQNILLGADGARITDFGLARAVEATKSGLEHSQTAAGSGSGTLAYMSPEQREGRHGDLRSDIFSFGVLLCQLLTGKLPQPGDSLDELLGRPAPPWARAIFERSHCRYEKRFETAVHALAALDSSEQSRQTNGRGSMKCSACGHENADSIKFCGECGHPFSSGASARLRTMTEPQKVRCPFCQEEIAGGAIKCKHCGERLDQAKPLAARAAIAVGMCAVHMDKTAVGACVGCGNLFCVDCLTPVKGKNHCKACVTELVHDRDRKIERAEEQIEREKDRAAKGGPNIVVTATGGAASSSSSAAASSNVGGASLDEAAALRASIRRQRATAALLGLLSFVSLLIAAGTSNGGWLILSAILFLASVVARPRYTGAQCPYCRGLHVRRVTRSGCVSSAKVLHCEDCKVDITGGPKLGCLILIASLGTLAALAAASACAPGPARTPTTGIPEGATPR